MHDILSNKWRPKILDDIIGQDEALYIIKNILKNKYIHRAFIISGFHGIGKTTLGRIFTKCINCEIGITERSCNVCYCCLSIDNGQNPDSLEIDAASKSKVEDIKDIILNSGYKTYKNRFKTYIIDECHMLSINSFNFFLKILEEDNNNVVYIFITTNLKKIPETIRSRCINLELKKIQNFFLKRRILYILKCEGIAFENLALDKLLLFSNGSLRDVINIIEKIGPDKHITEDKINSILGIISSEIILKLFISIYANKFSEVLNYSSLIINNSVNFDNVILQIQLLIYKIILYKFNIKYDNSIDVLFLYLCNNVKMTDLQLLYYCMLRGKVLINLAPSYEIGFNMLIINAFLKINKIS